MIRVNGLQKSFGSLRAVDGVSFDIEAGRTFGLLGPNGAGKSTTINMIVGVLAPDAGNVEIEGAATTAQSRRLIGVAPQDIALYGDLTAQENLRFFASLYGYRGRSLAERVGWALDFAGLNDRARDRVGAYSGGMRRRLNLAAALIHEPRILLLDEPTVGVDPQSRNHIFACIERLKNDGLTIIYTTHYMEEAQRLCDRVAIMDTGRVLEIDTVGALIARHGGKTVVEFELERADDRPRRGTLDGTRLRVETDDPVAEINALHDDGTAFSAMEIRKADLETVFLSLTGRRLRDD